MQHRVTRRRAALTRHSGQHDTGINDTAAVLDCTAGPAPGDPYSAPPPERPFLEEVGRDPGKLRIGVRTTSLGEAALHPDCRSGVENVAQKLEALGHHVEEASPRALDREDAFAGAGVVMMVSIARELDRWSQRTGRPIGRADVEPTTWFAAEIGRGVKAADFVAATEELQRAARELVAWWSDGFDLLLTAVTSTPTPEIGPLGPKRGHLAAAPPA